MKVFGSILLAVGAAAVGAAAAMYAMKKREEIEQFDYDFDDEGPDVEGEDWAEEGSGLGEAEGRHVGGGFEVRHCDNSRVNVCGSEAVISR